MSEAARSLEPLVDWLLGPEAVRARAGQVFDWVAAGRSQHFVLHLDRLDAAADFVANVIRENYPDLEIPYHARWRHFGGRWDLLAASLGILAREEMARIRFDLAVVSVLLDAGAGPGWSYLEPDTGERLSRSEGLAVASLWAFRDGLFSAVSGQPCRADAAALENLSVEQLAKAFQVSPQNPLAGLEGRTRLMQNLGRALRAAPDKFGAGNPRIGNLFDFLAAQATGDTLPAASILRALLRGLGPVWPGRVELGGVNLGDVWRHPAAVAADATAGLVPFHKLSQWLAYSLVEPLEAAGLRVTDIDALTGLPEYRNGGLFLDMGVIELKQPEQAVQLHRPADELIVEWRALTVALLDRMAPPVRRALGKSPDEMPLARILEGGTWAAGRRVAARLREGGGPPLRIDSDGTVF